MTSAVFATPDRIVSKKWYDNLNRDDSGIREISSSLVTMSHCVHTHPSHINRSRIAAASIETFSSGNVGAMSFSVLSNAGIDTGIQDRT